MALITSSSGSKRAKSLLIQQTTPVRHNQRDDMQVDWTGLHNLFGAAGALHRAKSLLIQQTTDR